MMPPGGMDPEMMKLAMEQMKNMVGFSPRNEPTPGWGTRFA